MAAAFQSRSHRPGAVSLKKSLGQRCGVERAPRWPRRQPRQVRQHESAPWAFGRYSTGKAHAGRMAHGSRVIVSKIRSRSNRPGEVALKWSLGQRRGIERAQRWLQRQPRQVRQRTRAPWAVDWFSTGRSARGPRGAEFGRGAYNVLKTRPPIGRGVSKKQPELTEWGGARPALAAKTITPSPPAHVFYGRSDSSPRGEARAGRATRDLEPMAMRIRRRSRRPSDVALNCCLGQRRAMECAPR